MGTGTYNAPCACNYPGKTSWCMAVPAGINYKRAVVPELCKAADKVNQANITKPYDQYQYNMNVRTRILMLCSSRACQIMPGSMEQHRSTTRVMCLHIHRYNTKGPVHGQRKMHLKAPISARVRPQPTPTSSLSTSTQGRPPSG